MSELNEIYLLTDDYEVSIEDHERTRKLFTDLGYEVKAERADTHAIGGPCWSASGYILFIGATALQAVLGKIFEKGIDELIAIFKRIKSKDLKSHYYIASNLNNGIKIYFEMDTFNPKTGEVIADVKSTKEAIEKIPTALIQAELVFSEKLIKFIGSPRSIILHYDFPLKEWLFHDHDSDASIYFSRSFFSIEPNKSLKTKILEYLRIKSIYKKFFFFIYYCSDKWGAGCSSVGLL